MGLCLTYLGFFRLFTLIRAWVGFVVISLLVIYFFSHLHRFTLLLYVCLIRWVVLLCAYLFEGIGFVLLGVLWFSGCVMFRLLFCCFDCLFPGLFVSLLACRACLALFRWVCLVWSCLLWIVSVLTY